MTMNKIFAVLTWTLFFLGVISALVFIGLDFYVKLYGKFSNADILHLISIITLGLGICGFFSCQIFFWFRKISFRNALHFRFVRMDTHDLFHS